MKTILMSIKSQWVAKILNGEKTIEIRKRFPKDYVGWVYIYCTKDKKYIYREFNGKYFKLICSTNTLKQEIEDESTINGQVVARFWCDKVEEIDHWFSITPCFNQTCLSSSEFADYIGSDIAYAIYITKLEIFDKPKEISEFYHYVNRRDNVKGWSCEYDELTRAPQSWCYVEV